MFDFVEREQIRQANIGPKDQASPPGARQSEIAGICEIAPFILNATTCGVDLAEAT
jgi:hypothetical protein